MSVLSDLRTRYRRWKMTRYYSRIFRLRHDKGPGFTPLMYAWGRMEEDELGELTEDGFEWHWPDE